MDSELEDSVKHCSKCQEHQRLPAKAPMHPWEWPDRPWSRIHVDYAGPIEGKMVLIMVDAHSKWLEALVVNSATSQTTIEKLRSVFATHGLPEVLVSDNGSVFTSADFDEFVRRNGIKTLDKCTLPPSLEWVGRESGANCKDSTQESYYWNIPGDSNIAILISILANTPHYYRNLPSRTANEP